MPHLLIGGTTGSGKSVAINAMLMSILMRTTPAEVRLILIDPKRVELSALQQRAAPLRAGRHRAQGGRERAGVVRLGDGAAPQGAAGRRRASNIGAVQRAWSRTARARRAPIELPYLVIVIDELADLMMVAAKEVEDSIVRIAQLARAAGIHLIVATQRPEANVVTGIIKANITNRIAFNVASAIDSRVILDQPGAEKLVGLGDMLFSHARVVQAQAHPGLLRRRGGDRGRRRPPQAAGRARLPRGDPAPQGLLGGRRRRQRRR